MSPENANIQLPMQEIEIVLKEFAQKGSTACQISVSNEMEQILGVTISRHLSNWQETHF